MANSTYKNYKPISNSELSDLGMNKNAALIVNKIEELRESPPGIVVAQCVKNVSFTQNGYKKNNELKKKVNYVMGLGIYNQLHYDVVGRKELLKPSPIKFKNIYKPYFGQDLTNKNLLVWRHGGIGDLLFIQPNLKYLKEKYPTCNISFASGPQYQSMISNWDCIDEVIDLPFTVNTIFKNDYHCIFEGVIERSIEAHEENAYRLFSRWMGLNLPDELLIPEQPINENSLEKCKNILKEWNLNEKEFIIVQMESSSPIRNPNPVIFKKIINKLTSEGYKILLTDNPKKAAWISSFISELNDKNNVFNFCEHSSEIADTISMTSLAKLAIAPDSALNHIAVSVNTKTFGIYGPFTGKIRLSTYPKNLCDWIDAKSQCSPCFIHSMENCKNSFHGYSSCYDTLNTDELVERIINLYHDKNISNSEESSSNNM